MNGVIDWICYHEDLLFEIVLFSWALIVVIAVGVDIWNNHRKR